MKVLVDATAVPANRGGVGRYVDALLPALAAEGLDLVVVCQDRDAALLAELVPHSEVVPASPAIERRPVRLAWEQQVLPSLIRSTCADLVHSPHYTMPLRSPRPVVVTLHDATFFSHPALHSAVKARFFRAATRLAVRRAAALVVPSRATRDEVVRHTGARPEVFYVAYHGVDRTVFHPATHSERVRVRASLGIGDGRYVAFLGTLEPRKNVPALVRGWTRAVRDRDDPPALLLAGGAGWDAGVEPAMATVPDRLTIRRTGYLPLDDLSGFLSGADVVAYVSRAEGFGLPVLEAMACGAAVLTSRELSLPEVGGEAVEYCGTSDDEIAAALGRLLDDPSRRAALAAAGQRRAAEFTWAVAARAHVKAFESALRAT